ncbi:uncharacterized protein LODBEIA_P59990 [Lodderomyces beijingensis]|uniref:Uncharacterized protein n=1 Tax=Lodderomyces beijingensis TaxID=1775926 RepID=A0ABP0ZXG6_9ASCO
MPTRNAAAQVFEELHTKMGNFVIHEIIPQLLTDLNATTVVTLKELMANKSDIIFPITLPALLKTPID